MADVTVAEPVSVASPAVSEAADEAPQAAQLPEAVAPLKDEVAVEAPLEVSSVRLCVRRNAREVVESC